MAAHSLTTHEHAWTDSTGARIAAGALGGFLAGVAFIAVTAWFAATNGQPPLAPFMMIATLVQGPAAMATGTAAVWIGMVVHSVLSVAFGVGFAVLTQPVRRRNGALAVAGLVYGGVLYAVNFQILAQFVPQFSALSAANQAFELATHLFFGALLALFLLSPDGGHARVAGPGREQPAERAPHGSVRTGE